MILLALLLAFWPTSCNAVELDVQPGAKCILPIASSRYDGTYSPAAVTVMHLVTVPTSGKSGAWVSLIGVAPGVWRLVPLSDLVGCNP